MIIGVRYVEEGSVSGGGQENKGEVWWMTGSIANWGGDEGERRKKRACKTKVRKGTENGKEEKYEGEEEFKKESYHGRTGR